LEELTSDFQYNLQLLAERDAELEAADAAAANAAAEMAAKASAITQLQAQLAQAHSGERAQQCVAPWHSIRKAY
jgi:alkylation response protein AidB-like acyl-CoA dehydrogenase